MLEHHQQDKSLGDVDKMKHHGNVKNKINASSIGKREIELSEQQKRFYVKRGKRSWSKWDTTGE